MPSSAIRQARASARPRAPGPGRCRPCRRATTARRRRRRRRAPPPAPRRARGRRRRLLLAPGINRNEAGVRTSYADSLRDRSGWRALRPWCRSPARRCGSGTRSSWRRRARRAAMVERAGFEFHALGEPWDRAAKWAPVFNGNAPGAAHVVQELFIALDARAALPGMLALVHNDRPDLIVRETTEFSSCVAAAHFDVPVVDVGPHLDAGIDTDGAAARAGGAGARAAGPFRLDAPVITLSPFGGNGEVTRFRHPARRAGRRVADLRLLRLRDSLAGPVPLHRAGARRRPEAGADDDRPPRRPGRRWARCPRTSASSAGSIRERHAARRGDGRAWRLRRDAGGAGRGRPDRVPPAVRRRPGQRGAVAALGAGIIATDVATRSAAALYPSTARRRTASRARSARWRRRGRGRAVQS